MTTAILEGFITGLAMLIFVGPVFFTLLQSSLEKGYKAGLAIAFGIFISDILCVLLCYVGVAPFFESQNHQFWLASIGACLLVILGLKYIFWTSINTEKTISFSNTEIITFFSKGFAINFINPFVFLVWIGVVTYAKQKFTSSADSTIFLTVALLTILLTDSLKVLLSHKIAPIIKPSFLRKTYQLLGVLLIVFAVRMIIYVW